MSVLVGKQAPDFTVPAVLGNGEIVDSFNFSDATSGKYAVVFFYPLDFTFVCPSELIALDHRMDDYVALILGDTKLSGDGYNDYIDRVKRFMCHKQNYKKMTTSQLRNIFARVQKIESKRYYKLYLLRPKLAFIAGRSDTTNQMKTMIFLLDQLISNVDSPEKLEQFQAFYEAVIAYHKYYGGKENE